MEDQINNVEYFHFQKKKTRKECGENDALLHENGVVTVIVLVAPSSGIYSSPFSAKLPYICPC